MHNDFWNVIINPNASGTGELDSMDEILERLGPCRVIETQSPGHARETTRQLMQNGRTKIAVAGGDGSFNQILNAVAPDFDQVELALLPLGTGNDLARALGIPEDPAQAAEWLAGGDATRLDVVRLSHGRGTHYFVNTSTGGFSTKVDEKIDPAAKSLLGSLAYLVSAARALPELDTYQLKMTLDGGRSEQLLESEAYAVVVANGRFIAGGIPISPEGNLEDGLVDLLIVPQMPAASMMIFLTQLLRGEHLKNENVIFRKVRKIKVEAEPAFSVNTDGEIIATTPVEYEVLPNVLQMRLGSVIQSASET